MTAISTGASGIGATAAGALATGQRMNFEDVAVGTEVTSIVRGPMSPIHLMRWSAAIENWHRIHYDWRFATNHDGLPDVLINGSWKQHLLVQLMRGWLGSEGWLWQLSYQFRKMDVGRGHPDRARHGNRAPRVRRLRRRPVRDRHPQLRARRRLHHRFGTRGAAIPRRPSGALPIPTQPHLVSAERIPCHPRRASPSTRASSSRPNRTWSGRG